MMPESQCEGCEQWTDDLLPYPINATQYLLCPECTDRYESEGKDYNERDEH